MTFNGNKFKLLRFGKNENFKNETFLFTPNMTEIIETYDQARDLGITIDIEANWAHQRKNSAKKP